MEECLLNFEGYIKYFYNFLHLFYNEILYVHSFISLPQKHIHHYTIHNLI